MFKIIFKDSEKLQFFVSQLIQRVSSEKRRHPKNWNCPSQGHLSSTNTYQRYYRNIIFRIRDLCCNQCTYLDSYVLAGGRTCQFKKMYICHYIMFLDCIYPPLSFLRFLTFSKTDGEYLIHDLKKNLLEWKIWTLQKDGKRFSNPTLQKW